LIESLADKEIDEIYDDWELEEKVKRIFDVK
jgi:hypothetical protein